MPPLSFGQLFGLGVATNAANTIMSIPTGLIDQAFYRRNLNLQTQAQKELIDYQNQYNTPSAQMQRLSEAGMNPHLVYGSQAPAGVSGNASAPSGHSPEGWNTADIARSILQMQEMKQSESTINLQNANAEKARADARFTNSQADRYNELVNVQIAEANKRIDEIASKINLNNSSIQLQTAQKNLAVADEAYRRGEIGLQEYRKSQIVAQTALFMSQEALNRTHDYYADIEGQLSVLELEYSKLYYDAEGGMKKLADEDRKVAQKRLEYEAGKIAASIGIESSETVKWIDWIVSELGKLLGGAGMAALGGSSVVRNMPGKRNKIGFN